MNGQYEDQRPEDGPGEIRRSNNLEEPGAKHGLGTVDYQRRLTNSREAADDLQSMGDIHEREGRSSRFAERPIFP